MLLIERADTLSAIEQTDLTYTQPLDTTCAKPYVFTTF
jgi:hypothetical protein